MECVPYANQQGQPTAAQYTPDAASYRTRALGAGCLDEVGKTERDEVLPVSHGKMDVRRNVSDSKPRASYLSVA
jgi:hypothetical protein